MEEGGEVEESGFFVDGVVRHEADTEEELLKLRRLQKTK